MNLFQPNELKISKAISELHDELIDRGAADVFVAKEVSEFEAAVEQVGKTNLVGEHFKRSLNTLPPDHVLWAGIYNKQGECLCTVAAQYLSFAERSLDRHLIDYFERCYEAEGGGLVEIERGSFAFLSLAKGPFVYVGEGFVREGFRGRNFLGILQRLLILSAYLKWKPELIYGFMEPRMIKKRYHTNWGYSVAEPSGIIWRKRPSIPVWRDPYFVGLSAEGVSRLVEDPLMAGTSQRHENSKRDNAAHSGFETEAPSADSVRS